MKATGIVRKVDNLGRVVIPREICRTHGIELGETPLEIFVDGDKIILRKYQPTCALCDSSDVIERLAKNGIILCRKCLNDALKEG
jgi:transcriptional pleiotropic regulator of transition state genes